MEQIPYHPTSGQCFENSPPAVSKTWRSRPWLTAPSIFTGAQPNDLTCMQSHSRSFPGWAALPPQYSLYLSPTLGEEKAESHPNWPSLAWCPSPGMISMQIFPCGTRDSFLPRLKARHSHFPHPSSHSAATKLFPMPWILTIMEKEGWGIYAEG